MREHLDRAADGSEDGGLVDPATAMQEIVAAAEALDAWHASGREGPRPPGRLRPHKPERLGLFTRLWAEPAYRMIYDPDGRSYRDRLTRGCELDRQADGPVMPVFGFHGTGPVRPDVWHAAGHGRKELRRVRFSRGVHRGSSGCRRRRSSIGRRTLAGDVEVVGV